MALNFPYRKPTLLGALLRNESGGKNVANTHQGTSSGQAQGYFQITTGTWDDFGGRKYASTPLGASYAQQAEIASKIPLKRWDTSTLNAMRGTGRAIDPNRTLGENLQMHQEDFASAPAASASTSAPAPAPPHHQGALPSGATLDTVTEPPPAGLFASDELKKDEDKKKSLGGLLGQINNPVQQPLEMQNLLPQGGGGGNQPSLAMLIQQYITSQMRGGPAAPPGGGPVITPQGGSGLG